VVISIIFIVDLLWCIIRRDLFNLSFIVVELIYTIGVYLVALKALRKLKSRARDVLLNMYKYFLPYAIVQIVRCCVLMAGSTSLSYFLTSLFLEHITNLYLTLMICFLMRDLKFTARSGETKSTKTKGSVNKPSAA